MAYVPQTLGEFVDYLAVMATSAPIYERSPIFEPVSDSEGHFARAREGLANISKTIGDRAYAYLLARVEENWERLQTGDAEDLKQLKLSFGEMQHFLRTRKYRAENLTDELVEHTAVRQ